ncbi:MAG: NAD(P)/FAD-dependent oxidoreductase [Microbacteriaceae bacterium]|nr:NAD(P)/FAD-dependent oxidoreductase [Microbacteriaceae bacterium]
MATAAVIGSGPNGLAAAVVLSRAGFDVTVHEAQPTLGGGLRTDQLTVPGYWHDRCSAVHPMSSTSPFFRAFGLTDRVQYVSPEIAYAHAIEPGRSAIAFRDIEQTVQELGTGGRAWRSLLAPLAERIDDLAVTALDAQLRWPAHPRLLAELGTRVLRATLASGALATSDAAALLAGVSAHSGTKLPSLGASAVGVVLAAHAHAGGWPVPVGGSRSVAQALVDDIRAHGGEFRTSSPVTAIAELNQDVVVADVSARALAALDSSLPRGYLRSLRRFRYGTATAKVDAALDGPIPWADPRLAEAVTVHVGGTAAETRAAETAVAGGRDTSQPFVLVTQPTVADPSRAPAGTGILWAYCHVPAGSGRDMSDTILDRLEPFAPGIRDRVVALHSSTALDIEAHDENFVGGDIASGASTFDQLVRRPTLSSSPWRTPRRGLYLASASAAPGPGVHGMAGYLAARAVLADYRLPMPDLSPGT